LAHLALNAVMVRQGAETWAWRDDLTSLDEAISELTTRNARPLALQKSWRNGERRYVLVMLDYEARSEL
jgi:hypothetical protein